MDAVKLAVIGAGLIGRRHIELISANPDCELAAICDPSPAAADLAKRMDVPYFQSHEVMLDSVAPDGAIVATPNKLHVPIGIACAERSIDLLVEKPIADTVEEGTRLLEAAERNDIRLMVGQYRRFNPLIQKAREVVQSGEIGRLVAVSMLWALQKPEPYFEAAWRTQPGGGPVLINLIHHIDDLRYICGEIERIYAMTSSATRNFAVEDSVSVSLQLANGVVGSMLASDATPSPWSYESTMFENPDFAHVRENCYFFTGSTGSLAFPQMDLWYYADPLRSGWNHSLDKRPLTVERADPLTEQLAHFCRVIRREEEPLVTGSEGLRTLAATLAILESARLDKPIYLDGATK